VTGPRAEAENRGIVVQTVKSARRVRLGDALAALGRDVGLANDDIATIDQTRDKPPGEPIQFE
jgi:antitoxin FitA